LRDFGEPWRDGRHDSASRWTRDQRLPSHGVRLQRFDRDRTVHDIDSSIALELNPQNHRYKVALICGRHQPMEMNMSKYAMDRKTVSDVVNGGGLLVVAQWEAREGQADKVAAILDRFLPEAQSDPGAKLFLIGRGKENPAQFLFYELFRDEAALKAHQESAYFKTYIADQALPLLARRERAQYALL
jgi:quinol monooxygenase YgiN